MASLESKKAKADAKAAEEAKKTEAEAVGPEEKLLASGMSADEILEKLKIRSPCGQTETPEVHTVFLKVAI